MNDQTPFLTTSSTRVRVVLIFVGIFVFLLGLFWMLFYAPALANDKSIMSLRSSYFNKLGTIYPSKPVYALQATAVGNEGIYTYKLAGRVKEMDYKTQVMTIRDMWGKEWEVHFPTSPIAGMGGLSKLVVSQKNIGIGGVVSNQLTTIAIDPQAPEATKGILPYEMVIVRWQDGRKAGRIKGIIELKNEKIVPIIRVVVEGAQ